MKIHQKLTRFSLIALTAITLSSLGHTASANSLNAKTLNGLGQTIAPQKSSISSDYVSDHSDIDISSGNYIDASIVSGEQKESHILFHGTAGNRVALALESSRQIDVLDPNGNVVYHRDENATNASSYYVNKIISLSNTGVYTIRYIHQNNLSPSFVDQASVYSVLEFGKKQSAPAIDSNALPKNKYASYSKYAIDSKSSAYTLDNVAQDDRPEPHDDYYNQKQNHVGYFDIQRFHTDGSHILLNITDDNGYPQDLDVHVDKHNVATITATDSQDDVEHLKFFKMSTNRVVEYASSIHAQLVGISENS